MRRIVWVAGLLLGLLPPLGASADPAPASAFGALPAESGAVLSADGRWIAWIDHTQERPSVVMFDVNARRMQRQLALAPGAKIRSLWWSDNETLLITLGQAVVFEHSPSHAAAETFHVIAHDVSGGDGRILPMHPNPGNSKFPVTPGFGILKAVHLPKPHTVVMATRSECHGRYQNCLQEVDTKTGLATPIKVGNTWTTDWVVDRDGRPVARADWDWQHHAFRVYALKPDDGIKEILRRDDGEYPKLAGVLPDGSGLVVLAANGRPNVAAWRLPLDGGPLELLVEDPGADVVSVYRDAHNGAIVGVEIGGAMRNVRWLDPAAQRRYDSLHKAFGDREIRVQGWSEDGARTLALVYGPKTPPTYFLVDFQSHKADIAAEEYPALTGAALGETRAISYAARDGAQIPGLLTMPPGQHDGPLPLVVLPHDGPEGRDVLGFDWMAQFIATRGYAVLQPQYRGSSGYGEAFHTAGLRGWGGIIQDDVNDGVRAMIAQGIADPTKVCIVGSGWGGFIALSGAAFSPDLYACAASLNGVADIPALMQSQLPLYNGSDSTDLAYWKKHFGEPNDRRLAERSPVFAANAIRVPILLAYSTADAVIPNGQSLDFAELLKKRSKRVTTVELKGDDHWLSIGTTRTLWLEQLERFLKDALGPR